MKTLGMIDVGGKKPTRRTARARIFVSLPGDILRRIASNKIPKGNVIETARIAGILASKKADSIIPLCHTLVIERADLKFSLKSDGILIESSVSASAKTGVEMEALLACSVSALTVYDMCKMFSKSIEITGLYLIEKTGGKSGDYKR